MSALRDFGKVIGILAGVVGIAVLFSLGYAIFWTGAACLLEAIMAIGDIRIW